MILNGQRIMALPCLQPSAALCDQHKLRSTPALSLHPGAQAPASPPPVIFRRITSPDVPPGITSWRSQPCVRRCSSAPCVPPKAALRLISAVKDFFPPSHERSELSMFFPGSYKLYKHSGHFQLKSSGSHCEAKISSLCRASSTGTRKFLI